MRWVTWITSRSVRAHLCAAGIIVLVAALAEFALGRIAICKCGDVLLWYGNTNGPGNSQHLSDWYSFSHIIHGFIFYGFLWLVARRLPVRTRFVLAILIECAWEVWENSPFIIDRYRAATIALDYTGDSVINSIMDILFAGFGFWLARKIKLWHTIALIILMEAYVGYMIRDNLTLNIVMLVYTSQAIKEWQMGTTLTPVVQ